MIRLISLLALMPTLLFSTHINLETLVEDYVLETQRIHIPGYPHAFNPGIVRWQGQLLLSFRDIPDRRSPFNSQLGVIWLDEEFKPVGKPQILQTHNPDRPVPSRAEDARLLVVGDKLFMVYDDNREEKISKGGFRLYVAELRNEGDIITVNDVECLRHFPGESRQIREKSWVPFDYQGKLLLAYSLVPHLIFQPLLEGRETCIELATTNRPIDFPWGILRGGTPALPLNDDEYLAFFHSVQNMTTANSGEKDMLHYFIGGYTFSREPPFAIRSASCEPIVGKGFYSAPFYKPYWHPIRAVFPCGYCMDEHFVWITYGRQDHECWVIKLNKVKFLSRLHHFHENS